MTGAEPIPKEILEWFTAELNRVSYGEVGIICIIHDGEVVRVKKHSVENTDCK